MALSSSADKDTGWWSSMKQNCEGTNGGVDHIWDVQQGRGGKKDETTPGFFSHNAFPALFPIPFYCWFILGSAFQISRESEISIKMLRKGLTIGSSFTGKP